MIFSEVLQALEQRVMMPERPPSLEPMIEGLKRIGFYNRYPFWPRLQTDPSRVILVAGTNGKGSVSATLEALLTAQGQRVGLYTSPHLVEITERFRIGGQQLSQELFCEAYERVESQTRGIDLSHFEMLTLMAVWACFSGERIPPVDRAVFEVGLGGIWDATNALPHGFCVITALGMDHEKLLGSTLPEIAANKLGIIPRPSDSKYPGLHLERAQVVHTPFPKAVLPLAEKIRQFTGCKMRSSLPFSFRVEHEDAGPRFFLKTEFGESPIALAGARGAENTALALTAFQELGFDPSLSLSVLDHIRWPGRMERLQAPDAPCALYASGDHNPQGIASLIELLPYYRKTPQNQQKRVHLLLGIGKDRNLDQMLPPLFEIENSRIYFTQTPYRGRNIAEYGSWTARAQGAWDNPMEALQQVFKKATQEDLIIITGSLYLVGKIQALLRLRKNLTVDKT